MKIIPITVTHTHLAHIWQFIDTSLFRWIITDIYHYYKDIIVIIIIIIIIVIIISLQKQMSLLAPPR